MNNQIFIIDDDPDDVEFIVEALRDHGYNGETVVFNSGRNFIDRLKVREAEAWPLPDLIILDINMHLVGGFECLDYLNNSAHFRHVPVILLSTSKFDRDLLMARDMRAIAYLYKPDGYMSYGKMGKAILEFLSSGQKESLSEHGLVFQRA